MTIYFYRTREGPHGCFSNFSPHGIVLDSRWWPTIEHYYQAQKFAGTAYAEQVRLALTPKIAAEIGRDRRLPLRPDWDRVKDEVMRKAVQRKFEAYRELREILLTTGDEEIVEKTNENSWDCGEDGKGNNRLGHILMEVRATLREGECVSGQHPQCFLVTIGWNTTKTRGDMTVRSKRETEAPTSLFYRV